MGELGILGKRDPLNFPKENKLETQENLGVRKCSGENKNILKLEKI